MKQPKLTGRSVGYARVSTTDQSLDIQTAALLAAGVALPDIHTDKLSGKNAARPGLQAAMAACQPGDVFTFWKVDRVGRSLHDLVNILHELGQRGVFLKCLTQPIDTTTAFGRASLGMLSIFAEFEREMILERTRHGLEAARARGVIGGKYATYRDGSARIMLDPEKAALAIAMKDAGHTSPQISAATGVNASTIRSFLAKRAAAQSD